MLKFRLNDQELRVDFAENAAVAALTEQCARQNLTIRLHRYGGFEQVGDLPFALPAADQRISAGPLEIMLYQGNKLVIFYGSNTWEYTPIGRISNLSAQELTELLSSHDATLFVYH